MSRVFVIAQGGGPTAVINQTLVGATLEARRLHKGARVIGARYGVRGVARGDFVELTSLSDDELRAIAATPGSALGSTRDKPDAAYCERILAGLRGAGADAFIYIGGNDTAGTLQVLESEGSGSIALIHAPKTIDNDLVENDHTPGFISAGLFVAQAFHSIDHDFRGLRGIYVAVIMGRHAGFLTASAAAWRRDETEAPHLVYLPESPFSVEKFLDEVSAVYDRFGHAIVAMSEGVATENGEPLVASLIPPNRLERDAHGNLHLSGSDLGLALQERIKQALPKARSRVDTFGYVPRSFVGAISQRDQQEAFDAGAFAARSSDQRSGSVTLQYVDGHTRLGMVDLAAVAGKTRPMPPEFFASDTSHITDAGMAYFRRLLPPPPPISTRLI
jgi:6-phosphofructokinase 1